ncbi:hypothetical protein GXW83_09965 [Streptacidiphilus sp. PB12-B1b]|uniref:hypothetical protein n=1 Tax=Streptacidiphilus sp. PB12-B1b TaxID=2705012 RepID=UPI0015FAEF21|nr:hypothetical protein [Streptacidiphilus sp. PB12-B1b]QMU76013.1 hypothetical protein GXW83_09965 [Streptacidiphilus sp. PB12-B1b]
MPATPQPDNPGQSPAVGPVRCPSCRREHSYEPPGLPCACGATLKVPLLRGGTPVQVRHRSWSDSWLSMRCPSCGRSEEWPQPEFTCGCGVTVRLPVDTARRAVPVTPAAPAAVPPNRPAPARPAQAAHPVQPVRPVQPVQARPQQPAGRPPFVPHPVRTPDDAVIAAGRFLEWLGHGSLEVSDSQDREGVCLLGPRIVAQVDTWTEPVDLRAVECLWLNTLHADELQPVMFTLAGYSQESRNRADQLLVALFDLDPSGSPQPVNSAAREFLRTGAGS